MAIMCRGYIWRENNQKDCVMLHHQHIEKSYYNMCKRGCLNEYHSSLRAIIIEIQFLDALDDVLIYG